MPAFTVHRLPDALDLRLAALTEPLAVACHDVRRGEVTREDLVVVIGAGPIGLLIALVAREEGARVVLSEVSPERLELARELGFETIDPRAPLPPSMRSPPRVGPTSSSKSPARPPGQSR